MKVQCPVDVYLYDMEENLCGAIVNNEVDESFTDIVMYTEDEAKVFYLTGDDYKIKLVGNGEGTMTYTIEELADDMSPLRTVQFKDVPLEEEKEYTGFVYEPYYIDNALYTLCDTSKKIMIQPDSDTYQDELKERVFVSGIELDKQKCELKVGDSIQLIANIIPENADKKTVEWTSENSEIATVDENGSVTAISGGDTKISVIAEDGGFEAICEIHVEKGELESSETEESSNESESSTESESSESDESSESEESSTEPESEPESQPDKDSEGVLPEDVPADGVIPDGLWIAGVSDQTYTGGILKPDVRVYDHDKRLQASKDYTITYKNNKNANDATNAKKAPTIAVKGKGNYAGTETATFKILPVSLTDQAISAEAVTTAYNKKLQKPVPVITFNGKKLKNKTDFTLSYPDTGADAYKESGTYCIKVTGKGNFAGELEVPFVITQNTLVSKAKISTIPAQPYSNGQPVEPAVTVKSGNAELTKDIDYTISYENNREIGTAYVLITGIGKYSGTKKVSFKITGTSIKNASIEGLSDDVYTGSPYTPNIKLTLNGRQLVKDTDYKLTCTNNVNAGTVSIKIEGINAYSSTIQKKCKVTPYDIGANSKKLLKDNTGDIAAKYTKGGTTPQPQLTFGAENEKLVEGRDYTITYKNNKAITASGKVATMTIKGKGNFKGTITKYFTIQEKALTDVESPVMLTIPDKAYTDKAGKYKSSPVLTDTNGNKLKAGTDYDKAIVYMLEDKTELTAQSKPEAGTTIHVKVTGKGAYTGTIEGDYLITKADFSKAKITIQPQVYTGKEIIPNASAITVKVTGNSTPLVYGTDYEIVAGSCKNNINKGTATITIKGKGNYGGTRTVKFKITARNLKWFWRLFG